MEETTDIIYEIPDAAEATEAPQEEAPFEHEDAPDRDGLFSKEADETKEADESKEAEAEDDPRQSELDAILSKMAPEEALELISKGRAYDVDVAEAEARGEIAGRNARIEQLLDSVAADRHPERNLSSGLPVGKAIRSIFDLADLA